MTQIMTTREIAEYLKLHEITICKYAAEGAIPAMRIGRKWRFEKDTIDQWLTEGGTNKPETGKATKRKTGSKPKK
jgi:excisionase family DNA binding protein